ALPRFSTEEKSLLKGSSDFFGLNHYSSCWIRAVEQGGENRTGNSGIFGTKEVEIVRMDDRPANALGWAVVPEGLRKLLCWIDARYGRPAVYITETGTALMADDVATAVDDPERSAFIGDYLAEARKACAAGVDLCGWFVWTLLDNFEWSEGYRIRFGLVHVDFGTGVRTPKKSFHDYRNLIQSNGNATSRMVR
ncbi:MAG: family 1 glycosylhydrolase, partial [Kiritimatiellales bacterium]|nr:family 1 glycosylhydrolase [Kiritimatiellales bacterium]